ncbi:MAG: 2'-deoxycytidine 5'-triphosphate deaminase [Nanoarchaeota archaeon]|nr:2'-deoxycytidine 5'-triphosphate deaminase [Nanoarchaeota archaeon]
MVLTRGEIKRRAVTEYQSCDNPGELVSFLFRPRGAMRSTPTKCGLVADPQDREGDRFAHFIAPAEDRADPTIEEKDRLLITNLDPALMSPAGFDLRVGEEVYFSKYNRNVLSLDQLRELAKRGEVKKAKPNAEGKILLTGDPAGNNVYFIVSHETIKLPSDLSLLIDSKSSTGRLACMCIDKSRLALEMEHTSPVIVSAQPYWADLEIEPGKSSLVQAILRYRHSPFMTREDILKDGENISYYHKGEKLDLPRVAHFAKEGMAMTFSTGLAFRGKEKRRLPGPIDVDAKGTYNVRDYFDTLEGNGELEILPRRFYLMGTQEEIRLGGVCGILSRETPDTGTGLWGHFAGVIWQGFAGEITMEVRSESRRLISQGDFAGFLQFDKLEKWNPGAGYCGNYQNQKVPKAPKMFKS